MNSIIYYKRISHTCMSFGKVRHILLHGIPSILKLALPVFSFRRCKKKHCFIVISDNSKST